MCHKSEISNITTFILYC